MNTDIEAIESLAYRLAGLIWTIIIGGGIVTFFFLLWTSWIPALLSSLAKKNRFVARVDEAHCAFLTKGGSYVKTLLQYKGYTIGNGGRIIPGDIKSTMNFGEYLLYSFFGYFWIGFQSPAIFSLATKKITVTSQKKEIKKGTDYETFISFFEQRELTISELRATFTLDELVQGIELGDTCEMSTHVRGTVKVTNPYTFWFGNGGKNFAVLRDAIHTKVRNAFEQTLLVELIQGKAEDEIEVKLKEGMKDLVDTLGVEVTTIEVVYWDYKAPDEIARLIARLGETKTRIEQAQADADVGEAEAEAQISVARARARLMKELEEANGAEWKSLLALAGGNEEIALLILQHDRLGDELAKVRLADSVANYSGGTLVLGGNQPITTLPLPTSPTSKP